eukprot:GEMP01012912.1.p1 GENE.GEMP01012912.1~~GEMP01012912.1.p1  ORF type:complete len:448 (-),score=108.20 GEMP01012912.1:1704-3047(-)
MTLHIKGCRETTLQYIALEVVELPHPAGFHFPTQECCIVPQVGQLSVRVERNDKTCRDELFYLEGRRNVFREITDFLYIGRDTTFAVTGPPKAQFCICKAYCDKKLSPKYGPKSGVQVELRGRGQASRQINNFMSPSAWTHCDKLCCVEVITPEGNWSSYPPHKHDEAGDGAINEEIYFFQVGSDNPKAEEPYAFHRTFTADSSIDETVTVHSGDAFLVPKGYHGPCVTPPGFHLYYLNILSGPNPERSMAFCWKKEYEWIVNQWPSQLIDARLPLCSVPLKGAVVLVCEDAAHVEKNLSGAGIASIVVHSQQTEVDFARDVALLFVDAHLLLNECRTDALYFIDLARVEPKPIMMALPDILTIHEAATIRLPFNVSQVIVGPTAALEQFSAAEFEHKTVYEHTSTGWIIRRPGLAPAPLKAPTGLASVIASYVQGLSFQQSSESKL